MIRSRWLTCLFAVAVSTQIVWGQTAPVNEPATLESKLRTYLRILKHGCNSSATEPADGNQQCPWIVEQQFIPKKSSVLAELVDDDDERPDCCRVPTVCCPESGWYRWVAECLNNCAQTWQFGNCQATQLAEAVSAAVSDKAAMIGVGTSSGAGQVGTGSGCYTGTMVITPAKTGADGKPGGCCVATSNGSHIGTMVTEPSKGYADDKLDNNCKLNSAKIIFLVRSGVDEDTIIKCIDDSPLNFNMKPELINWLKAHGVSDRVIMRMTVRGHHPPSEGRCPYVDGVRSCLGASRPTNIFVRLSDEDESSSCKTQASEETPGTAKTTPRVMRLRTAQDLPRVFVRKGDAPGCKSKPGNPEESAAKSFSVKMVLKIDNDDTGNCPFMCVPDDFPVYQPDDSLPVDPNFKHFEAKAVPSCCPAAAGKKNGCDSCAWLLQPLSPFQRQIDTAPVFIFKQASKKCCADCTCKSSGKECCSVKEKAEHSPCECKEVLLKILGLLDVVGADNHNPAKSHGIFIYQRAGDTDRGCPVFGPGAATSKTEVRPSNLPCPMGPPPYPPMLDFMPPFAMGYAGFGPPYVMPAPSYGYYGRCAVHPETAPYMAPTLPGYAPPPCQPCPVPWAYHPELRPYCVTDYSPVAQTAPLPPPQACDNSQVECKVVAKGGVVHFTTAKIEARCASVTYSGDRESVVLEGNVELHYKKGNTKAHITATRVVVDLTNESVVIDSGAPPAPAGACPPPVPCPVTPVQAYPVSPAFPATPSPAYPVYPR